MSKKRLEVDWNQKTSIDLSVNLKRYSRYLEDQGFRDSTIDSYVGHVGRYLKFAGTDQPHGDMATSFKDSLHERHLARSTINNYSFALTNYHRMLGQEIDLPFLKRNDELPFYFDPVRSNSI